MAATRATHYTGSFGVFLRAVNKPRMSLEPIVLTVLEHHGGKMELKALMMCVSATVREILATVDALKNRHVISLSRVDHDEFITLR